MDDEWREFFAELAMVEENEMTEINGIQVPVPQNNMTITGTGYEVGGTITIGPPPPWPWPVRFAAWLCRVGLPDREGPLYRVTAGRPDARR